MMTFDPGETPIHASRQYTNVVHTFRNVVPLKDIATRDGVRNFETFKVHHK